MASPPGQPVVPVAFVTGGEAVSWFVSRRNGGYLFDTHMTLIQDAFGAEVPIQYRAAVDPSSGRPTVLIIEVTLSFEDDTAWERLVSVQARLLEGEADLAANLKLNFPFSKIVISLRGVPSDWESLPTESESLG